MINKTSFRFVFVAVTAIAFLGDSSARAAILADDNFGSYTAGSALTDGAGGTGWSPNLWLAPSGATSLATVNDYSGNNKVDITLSGTATTVAAGRLPAAGIAQTFYVSYLLSYNPVSAGAFGQNNTFGLVMSSLTLPSTTVAANVFTLGMRSSGTTTDPSFADQFFLRTGTGSPVAGGATGGLLGAGLEYQLVAKLTYSGSSTFDQIDLWLNPGGLTETAPNATMSIAAGTGVAAINSVYFRQAANQTDDTFRFDNLVLATAWGDVVPLVAVPEPSALALALLGSAACFGLRRRSHRQA